MGGKMVFKLARAVARLLARLVKDAAMMVLKRLNADERTYKGVILQPLSSVRGERDARRFKSLTTIECLVIRRAHLSHPELLQDVH